MALAPAPRIVPPRPPVEPSNKFKARSFEDQVRYAYFSPPPNQYAPKEPGRRSEQVLGKISEARIPSALDHGISEAALVPGPGSYETPDLKDMPLPEGGRVSRKPPQEKFRLDEAPIPAPGTYGIPADPTVPRQLYGSFGKDPRITKFIQDEIVRSRSVPAPGEHDAMGSMESLRPFCPEGGRYLDHAGRNGSYFESAAKLATGGPGPDRYNLPGAIRKNKAAGKLVWKYQSETLEQTKKVITKVVGTGHEVPAPGHYTIPDPAPLGQVPTLKGRSLSHGMPHPYAYNCAPDHSRKFDSLAPVRDQNSGAQIFGRELKGTPGKDSRTGRAKAIADEVVASQMPLTLAERDIEQPGETVRWQSGGFASLRKVKSSPVIQKPEHPAVVETKQHYKPLSRWGGRKDRAFVPMAIKRPEIVKTSSKSDEYQTLKRKRWELGKISGDIVAAATSTLEPLDEAKLKEEATRGLMDKAKFRMRMEGLSQEQQELVLAELPGVLSEPTAAVSSARASAQASGRDSRGGGDAEEPLVDPPLDEA